MLCYSDDLCVWVRPENATAVANLIEQDMDRLGLLRNDAKSCRDPQYVAKVLGVGVDMRRMRFFVTEDKKTDLVRRASELVTAYRRAAVRVRELARVTGKIMALDPSFLARPMPFTRHAAMKRHSYRFLRG